MQTSSERLTYVQFTSCVQKNASLVLVLVKVSSDFLGSNLGSFKVICPISMKFFVVILYLLTIMEFKVHGGQTTKILIGLA